MKIQKMGGLLLLLILASAIAAYAQLDQGQISGTVRDPSQAVISGATVTARAVQTGQSQSMQTATGGTYLFTNLPIGQYEVTVEAPGFRKLVRTNVTVDAAARTTVDVTLEVGATTESITVSAAAAMTTMETAQIGRTVEGRQITDLALNGRNPYNMAMLKAGVVGDNFNLFNPGVVYMSFAVNGGRRNGNMVAVDGVNFQRARGDSDNHTTLGVLNVDAIQQVQILSATYPAEYGRAMDGQIRFVTKSGTRDFHGTAWQFFRNSRLDANSWTRNSSTNPDDYRRATPFRFNQPGYSFGGPVYIPGKFNTNRSKAFFFVSQEWMWYRKEYTNVGTVPTLAMRTGDFSGLLNAANPIFGRVRIVTDPYAGGPFANNVVPKSLQSPNGMAILGAFPTPTPGYQVGTNNWIKTLANPISQVKTTLRGDYYVRSTRISFSGNYYTYHEDTPFAGLGAPYGLGLDRSMRRWDRPNKLGTINVVSTLSPNKVNDFTISAADDIVRLDVFCTEGICKYKKSIYGINFPYVIPGRKVLEDRIPDVSVANFTSLSGSANPCNSSGTIYSLADNFTWIVRANHSLKFGIWVERVNQNNNELVGVQNGSFSFLDTGSPLTSGVAVANVALGNFDSYTEQGPAPYTTVTSNAVEAYAQDTWKATPKLTLEFGVRWSYRQPWYAKWNDLSAFDSGYYTLANRAIVDPRYGWIVSGDPYNGIVMPGTGIPEAAKGRNNAILVPNYQRLFHNLPRGFVNSYHDAFAPRLGVALRVADKTAIRAGIGLFHHRQMEQRWVTANPPVRMSLSTSYGKVDYPLGTVLRDYPVGSAQLDPVHKYPAAWTYSFSIQRELPFAAVLDVAYVGKTSINLVRSRNMNLLPVGTIQGNPGIQPNALRPWYGLAGITRTTLDGRSSYNSLQVSLDRRFSSGFGFGVSYTFSKVLSDIASPFHGFYFEKALDSWDRPHNLNFNYIYELPFLRKARGAAGLLGGWQLSGDAFIRSGVPLTVSDSNDIAGVGAGGQPWNVVGTLGVSGDRGINRLWFNPGAFALPRAGTYGNSGRFNIRGPRYQSWDLALFKNFRVIERVAANFRVEAFNFLNHPLLDNPGTNPRAGSFGMVTSKSSERNVQLALKFVF